MYKEQLRSKGVYRKRKASFWLRETMQVLYWTSNLALIILASYYLLTAHSSFLTLKASTYYGTGQLVVAGWSRGLILDVKSVQSANCPAGYQMFSDLVWEGTKPGCKCTVTEGAYRQDYVMPGNCNLQLQGLGCTAVGSRPAVNLSRWRGSLLCVLRSSLSFARSSWVNCSQTCGSGEFTLCVPGNTSCPLTSLSNSSSIDRFRLGLGKGDGYPIISTKITQFAFCSNVSEQNRDPSHENYTLERSVVKTCSRNSTRVTEVDSMSLAQFAAGNPWWTKEVADLPSYPPLSNDIRYKMGFQRVGGWSYSCRINKLTSIEKTTSMITLSEEEVLLRVSVVIGLCFFIVIGIMLPALAVFYHVKGLLLKGEFNMATMQDDQFLEAMQLRVHQDQLLEPHRVAKLVTVLSLKLLLFGLLVFAAFFFATDMSWLAAATGCGDEDLAAAFKYYSTVIQTCYYCFVNSAIILFVLVVLELVSVVLRLCYGDFRKQASLWWNSLQWGRGTQEQPEAGARADVPNAEKDNVEKDELFKNFDDSVINIRSKQFDNTLELQLRPIKVRRRKVRKGKDSK